MSGITLRFEHERRVAINDDPISQDTFRAEILLSPDGDVTLSLD